MSNTSVSRVVRAALLASLTLSLAGCAWLPWKGKLWGKPDEVRAEDAQPMSVEASSADPTALAIPTDVVTASADGTAEPGKSAIRLKQFPQAVAVLTSAAEGGDAQSQYFLGRLYYSGIGVTASELDARKWLTAAGEQSNADAAYALSGVLAAGAPEDRALATDWLKRAADGGHVQAKKVLEANSLPLAPVRDAAGNAALARELMKWAIRRDDPESLATFAGIAGVDAVDEFNRTVLAYAIERGSQVSVEKLLEIGASPTHADRFGVTPLMLAAENDSPAIMERMLAGADVARIDTQDSTGNSALIYAVRVAQIENVARLLSAGADVNISNANGWKPLDVAAKSGHVAVGQALRRAGGKGSLRASIGNNSGFDPTRPGVLYNGWSPLAVAASRDNARQVADLLAAGARVDEQTPQRDTPLLIAAKSRASAVVAPLLKAGANPAHSDAGGESALGYAASRGFVEFVTTLLEQGVAPNTQGSAEEPAMLRAARGGHVEVVQTLLAAGGNADIASKAGTTALMIAATDPDQTMLNVLVASGADASLRDRTGKDAMWFAAGSGNEKALAALMAIGVTLQVTKADHSALVAAVQARQLGSSKMLLGAGASANSKAANGDTPLIMAAAQGNMELVTLLLKSGAQTDAQNTAGDTALIAATREGHTAICRVLLNAGANAHLRNADRIDAVDTAKRRNLKEIVALLGE